MSKRSTYLQWHQSNYRKEGTRKALTLNPHLKCENHTRSSDWKWKLRNWIRNSWRYLIILDKRKLLVVKLVQISGKWDSRFAIQIVLTCASQQYLLSYSLADGLVRSLHMIGQSAHVGLSSPDLHWSYLIIMHPCFLSELQPVCVWKSKLSHRKLGKGINLLVVALKFHRKSRIRNAKLKLGKNSIFPSSLTISLFGHFASYPSYCINKIEKNKCSIFTLFSKPFKFFIST